MKGFVEELHQYLWSILTYFFKNPTLKKIYAQYEFFSSLKLNLPSCLISKWHSIAQSYSPVMWTSLGRVPAASGRDQPNQCTRCHLPAAGGTGALVWFIRALFWAPFNSAHQTNIKILKIHPLNSLCFTAQLLLLRAFNAMARFAEQSCPAEKPGFGRTNQRSSQMSSGYHSKMLFKSGNICAWPKEERKDSTVTSISTYRPNSF